jgi:hypothetical protein
MLGEIARPHGLQLTQRGRTETTSAISVAYSERDIIAHRILSGTMRQSNVRLSARGLTV